jgi:AcrR family transcriptional regulator
MGRWEPNPRGRLLQAAFELYGERGFEETTVAEIAERAGLTERTFFRHFADKREVLFAGVDSLTELIVTTVADAPAGLAPIDVAARAIEAAGAVIEEGGELPRRRHAIVAASAELHERELIKLESLASALAAELRRRGVDEPDASLSAQAALAVFRIAFDRWVHDEDGRDLPQLIRDSLESLKALAAAR